MRRAVIIAVLAGALATGLGPGAASAQQPEIEFAGQPFYFSATCTGVGDVILVNQSLARRPALLVVGSTTVIVPRFDGGRTNGSCTFTGSGFSIDTIEPLDEPFTFAVLITPAAG
jgi:hypothetical protein